MFYVTQHDPHAVGDGKWRVVQFDGDLHRVVRILDSEREADDECARRIEDRVRERERAACQFGVLDALTTARMGELLWKTPDKYKIDDTDGVEAANAIFVENALRRLHDGKPYVYRKPAP